MENYEKEVKDEKLQEITKKKKVSEIIFFKRKHLSMSSAVNLWNIFTTFEYWYAISFIFYSKHLSFFSKVKEIPC